VPPIPVASAYVLMEYTHDTHSGKSSYKVPDIKAFKGELIEDYERWRITAVDKLVTIPSKAERI
jgi:hypothetical protein